MLVQSQYQSYLLIEEWYKDCHFFNPTFTKCEFNENDEKLKIVKKCRSVKDKRRKMVQLLSEIKEPYSEYALDYINSIRSIDPFIVDAYEVLGKERIEELKYNQRKMNEEMILAQRKGNKVIKLIKNTFNVGCKYTNQKITEELTRIFNMLHIHPEKKIKGSMIMDYYQVKEWRNEDNRGYILVSEII